MQIVTGQLAIYTHPAGLWSIAYPPNLVHIEERPNGLVVFTSREGDVFLAVDSYQSPASAFGNTGENLRNRARDVWPQLVGGEFSQVDFREGVGPWDSGVVFSTTHGMRGQAFYQQPEQPTDPFPVYGVLYGYLAAREAAVLPLLESMRDSFIPRQPTAPSASQPRPATSDATPPQEAPSAAELPNAPANSDRQRVQFEPGETFAVVESAVVRGTTNQYVLDATQGQMMTVTITSPEQNAVFTLYGPHGQALAGAAEGQDAIRWSGALPSTGDYIVSVGSTRGNAMYTLNVTIAP